MYKVAMYNTIKTLLSHGKSIREIASELGMCRKTVSRIQKSLARGLEEPLPQVRPKRLDDYLEDIREYRDKGLSAILIHQRLRDRHGLNVSYPSVARSIERLKKQEVYVPLHSDPGEEGQVDFGYLGIFRRNGRPVKVWVFSMVLSHSRYSFYKLVTSQRVDEFLDCHIKAFEYFGGVPRTVKLDNLKSGVTTPDLYEPELQRQYSAFLSYYGCAGIACRPRRPQDKGKVESSIKYVKNNFLKGFEGNSYHDLLCGLKVWNEEICNKRVHGTTRRVPLAMFQQNEKPALLDLPLLRYEILDVGSRKVTRLAHVSYRHNYYSVPSTYAGKTVRLESNGTCLKIFDGSVQIAVHQVSGQIGMYVSRQEHRPEYKKNVSREEYQYQMAGIGPYTARFFEHLMVAVPTHWGPMTRGILKLRKRFTDQQIDLSCKRAIYFGAFSYQQVKRICENELYQQNYDEPVPMAYSREYEHELGLYDRLTN